MSNTHMALNELGRVGLGLAENLSETGFEVIALS